MQSTKTSPTHEHEENNLCGQGKKKIGGEIKAKGLHACEKNSMQASKKMDSDVDLDSEEGLIWGITEEGGLIKKHTIQKSKKKLNDQGELIKGNDHGNIHFFHGGC